jgi:hypothetical protein
MPHVAPKDKIRHKYSRADQELIEAIVKEGDYFGWSNTDILTRLADKFPTLPPTMLNVIGSRKRIRKNYNSRYERLRSNNRIFIAAVMEKIESIKKYKRELEEIKTKQGQTDIVKIKTIEMQVSLDNHELKMIQDLPYLMTYHSDAQLTIKELGEKIRELNTDPTILTTKTEKEDFNRHTPVITVKENLICDKKTEDLSNVQRISLETITQDHELQNILKGRSDSGLAPYFKK